MTSTLQITGGEVLVDDDLLPILACSNWHIMTNGSGKYRYARKRSARGQYLGLPVIWIPMHRAIAGIVTRPDVVIDHINGETLDNRRCNLRITTSEKNLQEFSRRQYMGDHPKSKISDYDLTRVFLLRAQGHTFKLIAEEFGVSKTLIRHICIGLRGKGTQVKPPAPLRPNEDMKAKPEHSSDK